jgi:hypothetical protein
MFEPENDLERSLILAANDPAHRPDFLLSMFNGQTFVAMEVEGELPQASPDGRVTIPPGTRLMLRTVRADQQEYLPFFTALSRARARARGNARSVISPMATRELFTRHPGRHFVLNPGLEHAQVFSPDDVNRMLAGQFDVPGAPVDGSKPSAAAAPPPAAEKPAATPPVTATPPVSVQQSVAKPLEPKLPEFNLPAFKPPETKLPEFNLPAFKPPETKLPEFNLPEFKPPEPKLPEFNLPEFEPPEPKRPEFNLPEFKPPEPKLPEFKLPELNLPEPKLGDSKPPESQPFEFKPLHSTPPVVATQPLAPKPPLAFNPPGAPRPPGSPSLAFGTTFSLDESFVFTQAVAPTLASTKSASADKPSMPPPASPATEVKGKPFPVEKPASPEVTAALVPPKPVESKSAAPKPSAPEKTAAFKTAATEALAAIRRFAAKVPASGKSEGTGVASAMSFAPVELPATAKPIESKSPAVEKLAVPESADAKPAEISPSRAAAVRTEAAPPSVAPTPVAPPATIKRVAVPPPAGAQIGKPDPYPVDVLFALTSAVQGMPAIEAAHLAQAQFPGRPPHLLVALDSSGHWEPLVQELGLKLQKLLPSGRQVELTPLTGGVFEDYFRNETQPFFKRR